MTANRLMDQFPPAPDRLVTLANWRTLPYSAWSYRNVRRLLPTAEIASSGGGHRLETDLTDIGQTVVLARGGGDTTLAAALGSSNTDAFVVLRRGRIAAEWYGNGMDATTPHIVFSISKSICGALGGILADRGLLDPDALVTHYIPELASSAYATCSVRHVLDMTVGISFTEDYDDPNGDVIRYRYAMGWDPVPAGRDTTDVRGFLATMKPDGKKHGDVFHYVSTNTDVLGWVYERACGQPLSDILGQYLWKPLGATGDAYITVDKHGAMRAAGGICVTPHDLARFGEMIRRRGVVDSRQVVPGWWIDDINARGEPDAWARSEFADLFPHASYRSKWYRIDRDKNVLLAIGIHGQYVYIHPEAELVIVRMASEHTPLDPDSAQGWRRTFDAIAERLL